jgi:hypothetical protein
MMKKYLFLGAFLLALTVESFGWGQNGHRVVGQLAEWHLSKKAKRKIDALLGHESLPMVANWMDEIRADRKYNHTAPWHYLTIEDGKEYDPSIQEKGGNAYEQTLKIIALLKEKNLSEEQGLEYLKMLVHLVGDLHQPLHVGRGDDKGGNEIEVYYFNQKTNLHSVWDTKMIEGQNLSFTELARHLNERADKLTVGKLQSADPLEWLKEAQSFRPMVYDLPDNKRLYYDYGYKYFHVVEDRLFAAGIRLAGILNDIYG